MKYSPILIFLYFSYAYATESAEDGTEASAAAEVTAAAGSASTQVTSESSSSAQRSKRTLNLTDASSQDYTVTATEDGHLTKKVLNVKDSMLRPVTEVHVGSNHLWTSPEHEKLATVVCYYFKDDLLLFELIAIKLPDHPTGPIVPPPVSPDEGDEGKEGEKLTAGPRPSTEPSVSELPEHAKHAFRRTNDKFVQIPLEDYESTLQRFKERADKDGATLDSVANVSKNVRLHDSFTTPAMYIATAAIALISVTV